MCFAFVPSVRGYEYGRWEGARGIESKRLTTLPLAHMCDTFLSCFDYTLFLYVFFTAPLKYAVTGCSFFCSTNSETHLLRSADFATIVWIDAIINLLLLFNVTVCTVYFVERCQKKELNNVANVRERALTNTTHLAGNEKLKIWIMTNETKHSLHQ